MSPGTLDFQKPKGQRATHSNPNPSTRHLATLGFQKPSPETEGVRRGVSPFSSALEDVSVPLHYEGTSLIRKGHPPRTAIGPYAYAYP